jgi:hypothetical protein
MNGAYDGWGLLQNEGLFGTPCRLRGFGFLIWIWLWIYFPLLMPP